jgi:hypothetical protein
MNDLTVPQEKEQEFISVSQRAFAAAENLIISTQKDLELAERCLRVLSRQKNR